MTYQTNPQLQLAYDFVQYTGKNIFLTGRAGTGKTTFLHHLKEHSPKRMVVTAPTGVAAINAAGVTLHSFFQLPFGPQIPGYHTAAGKEEQRFARDKINIMRSMELLVIDEISMVRADLLDAVDRVLRRFRHNDLPFGGVQLLMIGDLQQLSPVVKEEEWQLLKGHYETPYFFSSLALKKSDYVTIELLEVFRQKDAAFVELLNKIRDNKLDAAAIETLKSRYDPHFSQKDEGYIILTTHNHKAKTINSSRLSRLKGKEHVFEAVVWGNFPEYTYPTDEKLVLKTGAQVMFVKNDPGPEKLFYNGKIGKITALSEDKAEVLCEGDAHPISVSALEWEKTKYTLDKKTQEIKETVEGTFEQLPLKLAWAITIHKSQGLTFDKAVIDAQEAFAHGQVYVALSRCRSLEGLVLSTPIPAQSIRYDKTIDRFTRLFEENQPDKKALEAARRTYEKQLILNLFDFTKLQHLLYYAVKLTHEHENSLPENTSETLHTIARQTKAEITDVAVRFQNQLGRLFDEKLFAEENENLQQRIKQASRYFLEKTESLVSTPLEAVEPETDNKAVRKKIKNALDNLYREITLKTACLQACTDGFILKNFLAVQAKASIEEPHTTKKAKKKEIAVSNRQLSHPELYKQLKQWRDTVVSDTGLPHYMVLPLKTMQILSETLPVTQDALQAIPGIGQKKLEKYGTGLLKIISDYCAKENITPPVFEPAPPKAAKQPKKPTRQITLEMWQSGISMEEIATQRQLALSTIEGHMARFVASGEVEVEKLIPPEKLQTLSDYFLSTKNPSLTEAKNHLGEQCTYGELRLVLAHLRHTGELPANEETPPLL